jgi:hypothetical protein
MREVPARSGKPAIVITAVLAPRATSGIGVSSTGRRGSDFVE